MGNTPALIVKKETVHFCEPLTYVGGGVGAGVGAYITIPVEN